MIKQVMLFTYLGINVTSSKNLAIKIIDASK